MTLVTFIVPLVILQFSNNAAPAATFGDVAITAVVAVLVHPFVDVDVTV